MSHASALPTRAAILDLDKKQLSPVTVGKADPYTDKAAPKTDNAETVRIPLQRLRYHSRRGGRTGVFGCVKFRVLFSLCGTLPVVNSTVLSEEEKLRRELLKWKLQLPTG